MIRTRRKYLCSFFVLKAWAHFLSSVTCFFKACVDTLVYFRYFITLYAVDLLTVNKLFLIHCMLKAVMVVNVGH